MNKFKAGEVVYLKSGGVAMTVYTSTREDGLTETSWFNTKNELQRDAFSENELCYREDFK